MSSHGDNQVLQHRKQPVTKQYKTLGFLSLQMLIVVCRTRFGLLCLRKCMWSLRLELVGLSDSGGITLNSTKILIEMRLILLEQVTFLVTALAQ